MQSTASLPNDLIIVGHISGAFGVQGWVRIHPYSNDASSLLHAKTWWLGRSETRDSDASAITGLYDVEKLEAKWHGDEVVAQFMGVVGRDAAEKLKGCVVQIRRSHFPALGANEFYWLDLIGLAVENLQGESLGVVADLIDNGAHPILRVVQAAEVASADSVVNRPAEDQSATTEVNPSRTTSKPTKRSTNRSTKSDKAAPSAREYLIPFVEHFVPNVDQISKKITVDWGLDF